MTGKVSRAGRLKYLPSGTPVFDLTLAAPQKQLDKASTGYFEVVICGPDAEAIGNRLRVGRELSIQGGLWSRTYKNRQGDKVTETKVYVDKLDLDRELTKRGES